MSAVGPTIQFVASGGIVGGLANISVAPPVGIINGDLLLLLCESANQAIALPAGWTEVGTQASQAFGTAAATTATRLAVFYKFTTGTEANVTITDAGDHTVGQMVAFRNVDSKNPFLATASSANTSGTLITAITLPAVTTTIPNSMIVLCVATSFDGNNVATFNVLPTNANLTTITERIDGTNNSGNGGGLAMWTAFKTTVGNTGTTAATSAQAAIFGHLTIALRPKRRIIKAI